MAGNASSRRSSLKPISATSQLVVVLPMLLPMPMLLLLFGVAANLVMLLPALAAGARRLHDTGRTGWWQVLLVLPCFGVVLLAVFWCLPGKVAGSDVPA